MEMEMEVVDEVSAVSLDAGALAVGSLVDRLNAAAELLEQAAERFAGREVDVAASFDRATTREAALERMLAEAEATIASLKSARKTQPAGVATLLAREGSGIEPGALDAALTSLSLEQRFAVKAQLMRSGLIG